MDYSSMVPSDVRKLIRENAIIKTTSGMCFGYAQANLVILPLQYANDFRNFANKNKKPCPILEITNAGDSFTKYTANDANIVTDIPKYFVYRNGIKIEECTDVQEYFRNDMVCFLIGCSFSFEEALIKNNIEVRHISMGINVPMYKTNIQCNPVGIFRGPYVVSMRPMKPEDAMKACEITSKFPNVHGAPIHIGDPSIIGIYNINKPDYGDRVEIRDKEIPVFWACGVTPQAAIENAKPEIVITHAPGYMFITDILNDELEKKIFNIQ